MNIEQNKIVAEFMGMELSKDKTHLRWAGHEWVPAKQLNYHSDWSQLMPVVEKIEALKLREPLRLKLTIEQRLCVIQILNGGFRVNSIISVDNTDKISAVYSAVTQFIEWYTKTTTNANG